MTWQKLSSIVKYRNRYMTVIEEELKTDHGDRVTYGVVHKEPCVLVIPWDGKKILLVGQYRYIVDNFSWEFPMGHTENHDVRDSAAKELREEAGLDPRDLTDIGRFFIANGTMDQECYCYTARSWSQVSTDREPSEKGMRMQWVTLPELDDMIANGVVKDGPTIAAYQFFRFYLKKL